MTLYPRALEPAEIAQYRWAEFNLEPMPHLEPENEPEPEQTVRQAHEPEFLGLLTAAFWIGIGCALWWGGKL